MGTCVGDHLLDSPERTSRFRNPAVVAGGSCEPFIPQTEYDSIANPSTSRFVITILSPLLMVNPAVSAYARMTLAPGRPTSI